MKRHVGPEHRDDPFREARDLILAVILAGDEQGRHLEPDVGLALQIDQRLLDRVEVTVAHLTMEPLSTSLEVDGRGVDLHGTQRLLASQGQELAHSPGGLARRRRQSFLDRRASPHRQGTVGGFIPHPRRALDEQLSIADGFFSAFGEHQFPELPERRLIGKCRHRQPFAPRRDGDPFEMSEREAGLPGIHQRLGDHDHRVGGGNE